MKKSEKYPVSNYFDGYEEFVAKQSSKSSTYENTWHFFKEQFLGKFGGSKTVDVHLTSALDTKACKKIWSALVSEMVKDRVAEAGVL